MKLNNKNIFFSTLGLLLMILMQSCYEDLGNYNYSEINEEDGIGFVFVKGDLDMPMGDTLIIRTNLNFSKDTIYDSGQYEYEWIAYKKGMLGAGEERSKLLATTKDLNYIISLRPGEYFLYYRIKDLNTGIKWTRDKDLFVTSPFGEGWLALCEVNGKARLDMVNIINDTTSEVYTDLLTIADSNIPQTYLDSKPVGIRYFSYYTSGAKSLYILTEGGTTQVDPIDLSWQEFHDFSYEAMADFPDGFYADDLLEGDPYVGVYTGYMRKRTNYYQYVRTQNIYYDFPVNYVEDELFEASPYVAIGGSGKRNVLYDNTNKQFVMHRFGQSFCMTIPLQDGYLFDYKTGKELVYMDKQSNNLAYGELYSILKDPVDSKFYLARFIPSTGQQTGYSQITATNFDQAEHFAISPEFPYIFYVAGGVLYEYDWVDNKTYPMIDFGAEGIEVTMLDFFDNAPKGLNYANKLLIASYKDDESKGRLDFAKVLPRNEKIEIVESYNKLGKIVSLDYMYSN